MREAAGRDVDQVGGDAADRDHDRERPGAVADQMADEETRLGGRRSICSTRAGRRLRRPAPGNGMIAPAVPCRHREADADHVIIMVRITSNGLPGPASTATTMARPPMALSAVPTPSARIMPSRTESRVPRKVPPT